MKPLAAALCAVMALELGARLTGWFVVEAAGWAAIVAAVALYARRVTMREGYLLALCALLTGLILRLAPHPAAAIGAAMDQAGFLMAFILLLGMLHSAAATSPAVSECGAYLTRQPPGRRYYAINLGTGVLGVLFNLGVVSFLAPLIQRGVERATPGDPLNPIRERRQISAMLRGFSWCVVWSPTALAPLVVAELIPGVNRGLWIAFGAGLFLAMMVLGALEDKWRFRAFIPATGRLKPQFPGRAALRFAAACAWLFGMTGAFVWASGETLIFGLLMACPLMTAGWLAAQAGFPAPGAMAQTGERLRRILAVDIERSAPVAITLGCSGYIGRAAATLAPAQAVAEALHLDAMPDYVLLSIIPPALALLSLLALSPIMMAVFFGSLFGALPVLPADPTLLAFSISCGWALSMTFSPFATVVLLIERVTGIPTRRVVWGWNLGFTLLSAAALIPLFALLTGGT